MPPNIYSELLSQQSDSVRVIREHIEHTLSELETKRELCTARRLLLNTFKKDIQESFQECRSTIKKSITAMTNYLKTQQEEMLRELDATINFNMETLQAASQNLDQVMSRIDEQAEEGKALLREQDMFTFFAKGSLYRQLGCPPVPALKVDFRDSFPDLTQLSILPYQDGPELLHSATAKNTFEGPNDGWGWNKFVPLTKLADCTEVLFLINFNEMNHSFLLEEELEHKQQMDGEIAMQHDAHHGQTGHQPQLAYNPHQQ